MDEWNFEGLLDDDPAAPNVSTVEPQRDLCGGCERPIPVCLCSYYPEHPLKLHTQVLILQHPLEKYRPMRTVPLLQRCLQPANCKVIEGRRFASFGLSEILENPRNLLLYPCREGAFSIVSSCGVQSERTNEGLPCLTPSSSISSHNSRRHSGSCSGG